MPALDEKKRLIERLEQANVHAARNDLLEFILSVRPSFVNVNFHHEITCARLSRLRYEKGQRLIITMPPQYSKSEMVSRCLPAWMLGHFPRGKVILASYAASLARSFNKDAQSIMESDAYKKIFPKTRIRPDAPKKFARRSNFVETSRGGYLYSVGVGGSTTGYAANPLLIVDDPFKDWVEAMSAERRKKVLDWYGSVVQTRLGLDANVVVMHTRWHEGDLAGHLIKKSLEDKEATKYEIINFPALVEDLKELHPEDPRGMGEALWPIHKGDEHFLKRVEHDVGTFIFAALFQQRPRSTAGNIVNPNWWRIYRTLPDSFEEVIISVDCAFKDFDTSDYVVVQIWGRKGVEKYILDQTRDHLDVIGTCDAIANMILKYEDEYEVSAVYVEDKANGSAVMQLMKKKVSRFIPIEPKGSKVSRCYAVSPQIQAGNVYVPHESVAKFPVAQFIEEWSAFPLGANDDQVDSGTQALEQLSSNENHYLRQLLGRKEK
jgi:predicted phage terminase large subunit-like protein